MSWATLKHHGIVKDLPPEEVGPEAWTDGENVQFVLGVTRRAPGYARFAHPVSGAPLFALNVVDEAISWWIYCTATQVFVTDGTSHYNITPVGGLSTTAPNEWTGCVLNGLPVLNNTHNPPISWNLNPSSPCATLPGWPVGALCRVIRAFKYQLFALAIEDGGIFQESTLWWSSSAEPGALPLEWVPTVSNDAGDMTLGDTAGAIIDGMSLRDTLVIYKSGSVYMLSYVAGQYIYTQRKLYLADGLAARNCVAEYAGRHYIFTGSDVLVHDGQSAESMVAGRIKIELSTIINAARLERCWVQIRRLTNELIIGVPSGASDLPDLWYIADLQTGDWGVSRMPLTAHLARGVARLGVANASWDSDPDSWDSDPSYWDEQDFSPTDDTLVACCPQVPALFVMGAADTADGQPVHAWLERTGIDIDPQSIQRVLVRRAAMRIEGAAGEQVQVQVGGQAIFGAPIAWSAPVTVTIGQAQVLDVQAEGRLMALRVEGTTQHPWRLHSYKLDYSPLGDY